MLSYSLFFLSLFVQLVFTSTTSMLYLLFMLLLFLLLPFLLFTVLLLLSLSLSSSSSASSSPSLLFYHYYYHHHFFIFTVVIIIPPVHHDFTQHQYPSPFSLVIQQRLFFFSLSAPKHCFALSSRVLSSGPTASPIFFFQRSPQRTYAREPDLCTLGSAGFVPQLSLALPAWAALGWARLPRFADHDFLGGAGCWKGMQ